MPYKIYTYEDPYRLDETDFWDEIASLPHFCVARTLVNGLKDVMQKNIEGLICPLDDLINREEIYSEWTDNISRRVHQYGTLTAWFKQLLKKGTIDENFYLALCQNQTYFLDAIRLFIELGITSSSFDSKIGNREQRLFVYSLREMEQRELFRFPAMPSKDNLKATMIELAKNELADYCKRSGKECEDKGWYEQAIQTTIRQDLKAIVVHGVHQFSPVQLRLLTEMEKMGITVIFLFNYQKRFSKIYSSWRDIYNCFDVAIHHDSKVQEYCMASMPNRSNALAFALGGLCEGQYKTGDNQFRKWYQLYKDIPFLEFANITEYAHFVSIHFDDAQERYRTSKSVMERGMNSINHALVLRFMNEQVYTANRDVHTLLKIYYPEYAHDRHFLSYPIGQFFSAIYRLWDYEHGEILIDIPALKECLSSNVLSADRGERLLRSFYNLEILFENISTYSEFQKVFATDYLENYEKIAKSSKADACFPLRQISIYNKYKVRKQDVQILIKAIEELNSIATYLFAQDKSREDFISFGQHFHNLEDFLKRRELTLATEEERALISALQLRLDKIKPSQSTFSGTFRDLREGLYFYLKQKQDEDSVDWIVKNFEQIDGDILQSKSQFEYDVKHGQDIRKTYHFACLSDRDMNRSVNDLLPWPLTEDYLREAYAPVDLQYQVYYTALCERSGFLRYALFYGLCFNYCKVRLSYVKQYDNEITEPYAILSLLGFEPKEGFIDTLREPLEAHTSVKPADIQNVKYDRYQMMDMFLCPYRYFLDYVVSDAPIIHGQFLYQKYYENVLVEAVWKQISQQPLDAARKALDDRIRAESRKLRPFFPFWKDTEIYDLEMRSRNYLLHDIIGKSKGNTVMAYAPSHMTMRRLFGKAWFSADLSESVPVNPYPTFEKIASVRYGKKEYSLHKLPKPENKQFTSALCADTKAFLTQSSADDAKAISAEWCTYCVHRGNCMKPFLTSS